MSISSRLDHIEKTMEERKPQPVRVYAIRPGACEPEWMSVDELLATGADVQKTQGSDLRQIKRVLDYMAGPGCVIGGNDEKH